MLFAGVIDGAINGGLKGAVAGAVAGLLAALAFGAVKLFAPRPKCPNCGTALPAARRGEDRTCSACGCRVDAKGRKVGDRMGLL